MTTPARRIGFTLALVAVAALSTSVRAQWTEAKPFTIERLDPALDAIIAPTAKLETLGDRFALTEGPVWVGDGANGYLLFSDNAANVIYKWAPGVPLSVFLERSGFTGTDNTKVGAQTVAGRVPILLIGSNGLALDPQGRLVVTAMNDRTVYRLEADGTTRTVLADRYDGKRFNGPNDIVIKSNGAVYFTDTVWGLRGADNDPARELPYSGFFLIKDGKVTLLGGDRDAPGMFPNGITLSPDETLPLRHRRRPADDALRRPAGRHRGQRTPVRGTRVGRHARGHARQPLHDERRHAGHRPDHVAGGQAARTPAPAAARGGTAAARRARPTWRSATPTTVVCTSPRARTCSRCVCCKRACVRGVGSADLRGVGRI